MKERDPKLDSNDTIMLKLIPFSQNSTKCMKQYVRLYGSVDIAYLKLSWILLYINIYYFLKIFFKKHCVSILDAKHMEKQHDKTDTQTNK